MSLVSVIVSRDITPLPKCDQNVEVVRRPQGHSATSTQRTSDMQMPITDYVTLLSYQRKLRPYSGHSS